MHDALTPVRALRALLLPALVIILFPLGASAADTRIEPEFSAAVGLFLTDQNSKTRISGDVDPGDEIDLEADLGVKNSDTVFRFDGYWRFAENHRVDVSVFDLSRSRSKELEKEFTWQDKLYTIDTQLDTDVDLSIYKVSYTWLFMKRDWGFLGATGGLYIADIGVRVAVRGLEGAAAGGGATAPLPVGGLRGAYYLSDRWTLRGAVEIFALEYEEYTGSLSDARVSIDYRATDRFSLGLGYNAVNFNIGIERGNFDGDFDWGYSGAIVYLKFDL
ncbi:hypothetical protein [Luminiphilus syltensis]|uniref:hypothetical protein n=1 Tax=Luminiphilus syltensis TaxID=1341119 RepID=UPI00058F933B|nr:hypothetical protein [Luminiphilus syltensis]